MAGRSRRVEKPREEPEVFSISGARKSVTEDVSARQRRYLISMGVRTACFVLAVVVSGPLRWVFLVGAVILPYLSVVFANAGREPAGDPPPTVTLETRTAIESRPAATPESEARRRHHGDAA
ncbi:MAG: DUF3099 domain-containing protein [Actinomycetes bacterium]